MADQYGAKKKTVGELLSTTGPNIIVPAWQRSYSWDTSQAETFWNDLMSFDASYPGDTINDQEYFLGTIVLVDSDKDQLLLDGQQRLGTATILLSTIRDVLKLYNKDAAVRTAQKYITDFDDSTEKNAYKITLNNYDRDFFRREVQELDAQPPTITQTSHRQIRRVRQMFYKKVRAMFDELGGGRRSFERVLRLRMVLVDHVSLVAVTSADEDNAASVFETLNDRGIGLSTPDLLRNFLMQKAGSQDREEVVECWRTVLEVAEDAKVQEFLRHYWLSQRGDVKNRSLYREIKAIFLREDMKALSFSRDLETMAATYRDIAAARDDHPDMARLLRGLNQLGTGALMPALLSAYSAGGAEDRSRLLRSLLAFYIRHSVIGGLENSRLESVVFNVAKNLRQSRNFDRAIATLRAHAPDDDEFERQFRDASVPRRDTTRYLLSGIELHMQKTGEHSVELPDRVHIEHIYPQRPPTTERWPGHGSIINRLGNQTLLAKRINQAISNGIFSDKRARYSQSQFLLTKALSEFEEWGPDQVAARQLEMARIAVSVWSIPEVEAAPWESQAEEEADRAITPVVE